MTDVSASPGPIITRERRYNMPLADVKAECDARIGLPNDAEIQGHAADTLRVKSVSADGGTERWRVFIEWEPIGTAAQHGVFQ